MDDLTHILAGFNRTVELSKQGEEVYSFAKTGPLPTFNQQAKWEFAKKDNQIQLHNPVDGVVYHFDLPSGLAEHGPADAYRSPDKSKADFHTSAAHTAQVHRSDPGSIYFTVQDGSTNPTYTVKHVGGPKWHVIPKKRSEKPEVQKVVQAPQQFEQVKEAILKIAQDAPWYDPVALGAKAVDGTVSGLAEVGRNPLLTTGLAAGGGLLYDQAKRHLYNTDEENKQETIGDRAKRVLVPALGAGAVSGLLHSGLKNYYDGTAY